MRKLFTLLSLLTLCLSHLWAGPIDQTEALRLAAKFFGDGTAAASRGKYKTASMPARLVKAGANDAFYIINRGNDEGFVIVAADNRLDPILARTDKGTLSEEGIAQNPALQWLLNGYRQQIEWAKTHLPDTPSEAYTQLVSPTATMPEGEWETRPLLELHYDRTTELPQAISWGQGGVFSKYTPNNYPAGCVATAVATVMRWHQWPEKAVGQTGYVLDGKLLKLNFDGSGSEGRS